MKPITASGKRKRAIARATLHTGTGLVRVNHVALDAYEQALMKLKIQEPLILAGKNEMDIDVVVHGGGIAGQTEAARLAVARALAQHDKKLEKTFLAYDRHLLVADVRRKETRKPNDSKARAARQKSYR
ncbi:30S ribosomal protein S9 [Candidatus Woesearchaeota archaeon]|nr:30S ribosomal protein S9 [Candidatus Woesearchaeota archaeon]